MKKLASFCALSFLLTCTAVSFAETQHTSDSAHPVRRSLSGGSASIPLPTTRVAAKEVPAEDEKAQAKEDIKASLRYGALGDAIDDEIPTSHREIVRSRSGGSGMSQRIVIARDDK